MRATIGIIALLLAASLQAQDRPTLDTSAVVTVDSASASELHSRARRWFADAFRDAQEVIQVDDAAAGVLMGKGVARFNESGIIRFTVTIESKDGRYRYEVKDVRHEGVGGTYVNGVYIKYPSLGPMYDCDRCSDLQAKEGTKKNEKDRKACVESIVPTIHGAIDPLVRSIRTSMQAADKSDW